MKALQQRSAQARANRAAAAAGSEALSDRAASFNLLDSNPRVAAQQQTLRAAFGPAAQLQAQEEEMPAQARFASTSAATPVAQRTTWLWSVASASWVAQDAVHGQAAPTRVGKYEGDYEDDGMTAPAAPVITYTYDTHGDKHFKGQDSQWTSAASVVNPMLVTDIQGEEAKIIANAKPAGVTTYYLQVTAAANIGNDGSAKGPATKTYVIQVDYNAGAQTIGYHGYPCISAQADGLRATKYGKLL